MISLRMLLFILLLHGSDIHSHLLVDCNCKDTGLPQSQTNTGARVGHSRQDELDGDQCPDQLDVSQSLWSPNADEERRR